MACMCAAHSHSQYTVLCATSNLLVAMVINPLHRLPLPCMLWSMEIICKCNYFDISLPWAWWGVPPHQSHPQVPSSTQTGMPKYDLFSEPLLLTITFQAMTIKQLMYTQKVPFLYT